ncbi:hypothetical protein BKA56DRAFT_493546 [Ilyonectria sp. MPI-CAGE-AT-0026]|nr:hypothetical protein BKA56DRAFT_493546 [Ilyonectria sp. MPI-CAGE-AT-0026]
MVAEAAGIVPGSPVTIVGNLQSTSNEASPAQTSQSFQPQSDSSITSPEFCGPSSSEFTLNVVSGNLKAMGMPAAILGKSTSAPGCPSSSRLAQYGPFMKVLTMDPLWDIKGDDAVDLIDQWCNGVGSLYPVVDRDRMMQTANNVFASLESASRDGVKLAKGSLIETLFNDETNKMKIVLAIGRTLASGGRNDQAQRLFESTTEAVEGLIWNSNGIHGIQLLVLVALYHYHLDEEVRTGRIIGFAARLCLEMGLHRRLMVENAFPNLEERSDALRTFWSVYMLERRTSLGQGIPFSIQDSYVDPSLFTLDNSNPILSCLLDWTKLAGKTWQALNCQGENGAKINTDDLDYLDYQTIHWYEQLPEHLTLNETSLHPRSELEKPNYIQAVLFFRKSHIRNLIYRPVLQSAGQINQHKKYAHTAMKVAKETLQMLADLNDNTPSIRTHAIFFKHPLLTAFGNLLLAIVNASSTFWDSVRAEFDIALNLIKLLSTRSSPLMRLWKRLQGLQELQTKLANPAQESDSFLPPNDVLSFDQLFSAFQDSSDQFPGGSIMREHVNSLLDDSVVHGSFSNFHFDWE